MLFVTVVSFIGGFVIAIIGYWAGHAGRNDEVARLKKDVADLEKAVVHWKATAHVLSASVQECREELERARHTVTVSYPLPWSLN